MIQTPGASRHKIKGLKTLKMNKIDNNNKIYWIELNLLMKFHHFFFYFSFH